MFLSAGPFLKAEDAPHWSIQVPIRYVEHQQVMGSVSL